MPEMELKTEKQKIEEEQKKVLNDVLKILSESKRAREDDLWLCIQYWRLHGIKIFVDYKELDTMTAPETISRQRRIVQNEMHLHLPENPEVLIRRRVREDVLRNYFRGDAKIISSWEILKNAKQRT